MSKIWVRPSLGLFLGLMSGDKDDEKESGKIGGIPLGDHNISLGGLLGGTIGIGENWGFYTGIDGALSLIPFLAFGFIGIPIGFHIKKRFGFGLIVPVLWVKWYIGLMVGLLVFVLSFLISSSMEKRGVGRGL